MILVSALGNSQSPKPKSMFDRPITRAEVEQLFESRGRFMTNKAHAPREVAIIVWPAKDHELLRLFDRYPQWVIEEALRRKTPGIVPVLLRSLERNPTSSGSGIITALAKILAHRAKESWLPYSTRNFPSEGEAP